MPPTLSPAGVLQFRYDYHRQLFPRPNPGAGGPAAAGATPGPGVPVHFVPSPGAPDSGPAAAGASLYLTPAALAAWPDSRDPRLREWRAFLEPTLAGPGGDALLFSDTGLALLRRGDSGLAVIPPFPLTDDLAGPGHWPRWDAAPLARLLAADYTVGVILLRLGRYLVAVFEGERPVATKTDTRYVKGKHHAGGTSQLRFTRIRAGQIRKLYDETCRVAQSRFAPYEGAMDHILLGGERQTLNGFVKVCPYLQRHRAQVLSRRLNVRDPKHDTLETVAAMLRQSRVWLI